MMTIMEVLESLVADSSQFADVLGLCRSEFKAGCRGLRRWHGLLLEANDYSTVPPNPTSELANANRFPRDTEEGCRAHAALPCVEIIVVETSFPAR